MDVFGCIGIESVLILLVLWVVQTGFDMCWFSFVTEEMLTGTNQEKDRMEQIQEVSFLKTSLRNAITYLHTQSVCYQNLSIIYQKSISTAATGSESRRATRWCHHICLLVYTINCCSLYHPNPKPQSPSPNPMLLDNKLPEWLGSQTTWGTFDCTPVRGSSRFTRSFWMSCTWRCQTYGRRCGSHAGLTCGNGGSVTISGWPWRNEFECFANEKMHTCVECQPRINKPYGLSICGGTISVANYYSLGEPPQLINQGLFIRGWRLLCLVAFRNIGPQPLLCCVVVSLGTTKRSQPVTPVSWFIKVCPALPENLYVWSLDVKHITYIIYIYMWMNLYRHTS